MLLRQAVLFVLCYMEFCSCVFFSVNTSLPQERGGKDIFTSLLGTVPKKPRRRKHKGEPTGSVSDADKLGSDAAKSRAQGLSGNRSAENLLRQVEDESATDNVEVSFEIRKKYDMKQLTYFSIENEKRQIRRVKSNDSLDQRRTVVRQSNRAAAQTLPRELSNSRELLDDQASSGDVTTSDDARTESCASSVLESEL